MSEFNSKLPQKKTGINAFYKIVYVFQAHFQNHFSVNCHIKAQKCSPIEISNVCVMCIVNEKHSNLDLAGKRSQHIFPEYWSFPVQRDLPVERRYIVPLYCQFISMINAYATYALEIRKKHCEEISNSRKKPSNPRQKLNFKAFFRKRTY